MPLPRVLASRLEWLQELGFSLVRGAAECVLAAGDEREALAQLLSSQPTQEVLRTCAQRVEIRYPAWVSRGEGGLGALAPRTAADLLFLSISIQTCATPVQEGY